MGVWCTSSEERFSMPSRNKEPKEYHPRRPSFETVLCLDFGVRGLRFKVQDWGVRVQGSGFKV